MLGSELDRQTDLNVELLKLKLVLALLGHLEAVKLHDFKLLRSMSLIRFMTRPSFFDHSVFSPATLAAIIYSL